MFEKILQANSLGSQFQISHILKLLSDKALSIEDLNRVCVSAEYSFRISFTGVVEMLNWLDVIDCNDIVKLNNKNKINEKRFVEDFCTLLFSKMAVENWLHVFINHNNMTFNVPNEVIYVKNNLIELKFSPIRNLLLNFNFFIRDEFMPNQFIIRKDFNAWFIDVIIPLINKSSIKNNTLQKFKEMQNAKNIVGAEAEKFVLHYEQSKRKLHSGCENISIISDADVGAGYDIQSYMSDESMLIDKFIEVKSYTGPALFYWSKNESEVAKVKGDNYFLYCVDRAQIDNDGYIPLMIQNPYQNVFLDEEWIKSCENWVVKK